MGIWRVRFGAFGDALVALLKSVVAVLLSDDPSIQFQIQNCATLLLPTVIVVKSKNIKELSVGIVLEHD